MNALKTLRLVEFILLVLAFLMWVLNNKSLIKTHEFDSNLIGRYFLSQDIPYEPLGKRLFLSDSEIHTASGYLYVNGFDPGVINFQHGPLLKYLIGYSIQLFENPVYFQILVAFLILLIIWRLGWNLLPSRTDAPLLSLVAPLWLLNTLLFRELTFSILLDLGQTLLILLICYYAFYLKQRNVVFGILTGLLLTSKFWGSSLFFVFAFWVYKYLKDKQNHKQFALQVLSSLTTIATVYLPSFVYRTGQFNLIWLQLRTLKYWLNHSVAVTPGETVKAFVLGTYQSWWGSQGQFLMWEWEVSWVISLVLAVVGGVWFIKKKDGQKAFLALIGPGFLLFLAIQAPFARYYILLLPFLYLSSVTYLYDAFFNLKMYLMRRRSKAKK